VPRAVSLLVLVICLCAGAVSLPARAAPAGARAAGEIPSLGSFAAAATYLNGRGGRSAFAVISSDGRLHAVHPHWTFRSASLVKAMLLVSYLRQASFGTQPFDRLDQAALRAMITVSDNNAADAIYGRVGDAGLEALARAARMQDFSTQGYWGDNTLSVSDQAQFFAHLDRLVPARFRGFARALLGGVVDSQRWGIPRAAAGWHAYLKGGWRPVRQDGGRWVVNQAALLERGADRLVIVVLSDGNASMGYGTETIEGVARRLLAVPAA
jgi:hypothetical protein